MHVALKLRKLSPDCSVKLFVVLYLKGTLYLNYSFRLPTAPCCLVAYCDLKLK